MFFYEPGQHGNHRGNIKNIGHVGQSGYSADNIRGDNEGKARFKRKRLTIDEAYKDFKDEYSKILKVCYKMGINYNDIMKMTVVEINTLSEAYVEKRNDEMNKLYFQIHQQAVLNALARRGGSAFPKEPKRVDDSVNNKADSLDKMHDLARSLMPHVKMG